jgi:hypothetical protein
MRGFDATLGIAGKQLNIWELMALWLAEEEIVRLRKEIWVMEQQVATPVLKGTTQPGSKPTIRARCARSRYGRRLNGRDE